MDEQIVVAYDPDFDSAAGPELVEGSPTDVFDCLGAKRSFIVGLALAVMTIMSIGFIVLISLLLSGKSIAI